MNKTLLNITFGLISLFASAVSYAQYGQATEEQLQEWLEQNELYQIIWYNDNPSWHEKVLNAVMEMDEWRKTYKKDENETRENFVKRMKSDFSDLKNLLNKLLQKINDLPLHEKTLNVLFEMTSNLNGKNGYEKLSALKSIFEKTNDPKWHEKVLNVYLNALQDPESNYSALEYLFEHPDPVVIEEQVLSVPKIREMLISSDKESLWIILENLSEHEKKNPELVRISKQVESLTGVHLGNQHVLSDEQAKECPFSATVNLFTKAKGGISSGSATLIAPQIMITAAHCLLGSTNFPVTAYSHHQKQYANVRSCYLIRRNGESLHIDMNQRASHSLDNYLDIAVCILDEPIALDEYPSLLSDETIQALEENGRLKNSPLLLSDGSGQEALPKAHIVGYSQKGDRPNSSLHPIEMDLKIEEHRWKPHWTPEDGVAFNSGRLYSTLTDRNENYNGSQAYPGDSGGGCFFPCDENPSKWCLGLVTVGGDKGINLGGVDLSHGKGYTGIPIPPVTRQAIQDAQSEVNKAKSSFRYLFESSPWESPFCEVAPVLNEVTLATMIKNWGQLAIYEENQAIWMSELHKKFHKENPQHGEWIAPQNSFSVECVMRQLIEMQNALKMMHKDTLPVTPIDVVQKAFLPVTRDTYLNPEKVYKIIKTLLDFGAKPTDKAIADARSIGREDLAELIESYK